ncbi:hypothetical protein L6452_33023 [Arctium lappa]|uniref:Uncharacterized protein n=1 Tax=Arctium lappa TaxID=4217 RepID=A0ACB8Z6K7_ARCLA|nr:hypothetical protein L6452_33023 [Arctium lappa]
MFSIVVDRFRWTRFITENEQFNFIGPGSIISPSPTLSPHCIAARVSHQTLLSFFHSIFQQTNFLGF